MQIVFILSGSFIARRYKGVRIWVMIGYLAPSLLGLILQLTVPRTAKPALLFGNYLVSLRLPPPSPPHQTRKLILPLTNAAWILRDVSRHRTLHAICKCGWLH